MRQVLTAAFIVFLSLGLRVSAQTSTPTPDPKPLLDPVVEEFFFKMIEKDGVAKARRVYEDSRKRNRDALFFSEPAMNSLGYRFVSEKKLAEAIELFKLNVDSYPASANAYDSLAEAYMISGDKRAAIENYREALSIFPNNENEIAALRQLGEALSPDDWAKMFAATFSSDLEYLPNIEYGSGPAEGLKLDIIRSKTLPATPLPVIVFIHGGGWSGGTKERGLYPLVHFAQRGYIGVTVEYRLSGQAVFPAQIEDVKCAIRFLRANAKKYHIDAKHIGVWGQSAGGHLAALLGTSGGNKKLEGKGGWPSASSRVQAVVDWNGPIDFMKIESALKATKPEDDAVFRLFGGPLLSNRGKAALANPVSYVTKDDPPFLIMHGDKDSTVSPDQSRILYEALIKARVKAEYKILEGERHFGVSLNRIGIVSDGLEANRAKITVMMDDFFDKYLKG